MTEPVTPEAFAALQAELTNAKQAIRELVVVSERLIRHWGNVSTGDYALRQRLSEVARLLRPAEAKAA